MKNHYALIMAGGIGSRFWPISRSAHPKQFIDILGSGKTLIQQTFERFLKIVPKENIFILTNESYIQLVKEQLPDLDDTQILAEPIMRNTAPCIAYGSHKILKLNPEASIVVAPSDHLILNSEEFTRCIKKSLETASKHDCLISLGIKPSRPDTGYGYIQYNTKKIDDDFFMVKTFTEKPNKELAKTFVQSGEFLWNAGIFVWSVQSILNSFKNHLPEMNDIFKEGEAVYNTKDEQEFVHTAFSQCTNISIDYGIMEKADNVYVIPSSFGWSDLGTWNSAYENMEKDYLGNAVSGENVMVIDATRCMVHGKDDKLYLLQGMDDYILVDTEDVLLICKKEKEQEIKEYVAEVRRNKGDRYL
jgi:mannose-1-phosphate guanylyltransferase